MTEDPVDPRRLTKISSPPAIDPWNGL